MVLQWEDKEVKFDLPYSKMRLINGEKIIDKLDNIEDTKGNGGFKGKLIITSLRILWYSSSSPRINLSIGLGCILSTNMKLVNSKLRGTAQAIQLLTISTGTRYEFIFTNLIPGHTRHFTSITGVHKAYNSSRLYRELKLRGAVVHNKQLKILPLEQVVSTVHGAWNLSSDQGSLGTFIVTNVRFVWFADVNEGFNISLPYLQIDAIATRDSKFGAALVVTSSEASGLFVLGFKVDPEERLRTLYKELSSLHAVYASRPIFGVEYEAAAASRRPALEGGGGGAVAEEFEGVDERAEEMSNAIAAYLADEGLEKDGAPAFCDELGLAVERLKEGYTLQRLWEVVPSN
ncbi:unnamed protein product [Phyllotreta striolata]|uniref:BBSome complex member BBS5 PH domain-containing protein n=1 Tax=Phyllotreta striolata TaxID=444603 RepID=A0A9P0GTI3_PHYSR|nr:unnamed protein product [Phyllotreta striolata]